MKELSIPSRIALSAVRVEAALPLQVNAVPYRGLLFIGSGTASELKHALEEKLHQAKLGHLPEIICPSHSQLGQPERLVIEYENGRELIARAEKAIKALETDAPAAWQALGVQGIYRGSGAPGKVAFLFPGQGSQYVNMLRDLRRIEPLVAETFREADAVMTPILGRPHFQLCICGGEGGCHYPGRVEVAEYRYHPTGFVGGSCIST